MGVNFLIMWAVIDLITRAVITETRVWTLASWCCSDTETRVSARLDAVVMAMISPASGVDDLSLIIFR